MENKKIKNNQSTLMKVFKFWSTVPVYEY